MMKRTLALAVALGAAAGVGVPTSSTATTTASAATPAGAAGSRPLDSRIRFAPGATAATVSTFQAGRTARWYDFSARAGQVAYVSVSGRGRSWMWELDAPSSGQPGSQLFVGADGDNVPEMPIRLPVTGSYRLSVYTAVPQHYTMTLTLPVPIRFAPMAASARVGGRLPSGGARDYSFRAYRNQRATITFGASSRTARWTLVAPGGSPLHGQMTEQQRHVSVRLPVTGAYHLQVQTTRATRYTLRLSIPAR